MIVDISLGLSTDLAGLWAGLLLAVISLLHSMHAAPAGSGFVIELHRFVSVARHSPANWVGRHRSGRCARRRAARAQRERPVRSGSGAVPVDVPTGQVPPCPDRDLRQGDVALLSR